MDYRVDEKGKVFTTHVTKRSIAVVVLLGDTLIEGMVYLTLDNRLKDELNSAEQFIAITDAKVSEVGAARLLRKADVVIVNKAQIVWISPTGAEQSQTSSDAPNPLVKK